jgi:hypothetical protein
VPAVVVIQQKLVNVQKHHTVRPFHILMLTGPLCVFSEFTLNCTGPKSIPNLPFCALTLEMHLNVIRADSTERLVLQHSFKTRIFYFDVLLTVPLSIILVIDQLNAQIFVL